MAASVNVLQESSPLVPNQVVIAKEDFKGVQEGDLSFRQGEQLVILEESELLYWYKARNSKGVVGLIPRNFLKTVATPPPKPSAPIKIQSKKMAAHQAAASRHIETDKIIHMMMEREKVQRLKKGTLVVGRATFTGQDVKDMSFNIGEEMQILKPLPDLCWYLAKKLDKSGGAGAIPVTHVRLVYDSDEEPEENLYDYTKEPAFHKIYDDINHFISESGWFTFPGMALGKNALFNVLARMSFTEYEDFMKIQESVYIFTYGNDEKVFVGKSQVLHEELEKHFSCFGRKREEIREIDDELCHHTSQNEWKLKVLPIKPPQRLEVEWAKKVIEKDALASPDDPRGLNSGLSFTHWDNWEEFSKWFFPD